MWKTDKKSRAVTEMGDGMMRARTCGETYDDAR